MLAAMSYHGNHRLVHRPKHATGTAKKTSSSRPKARPPTSQPVDAAELTRRLAVVLSEQKAKSNNKRQVRAEADLLSSNAPEGFRTCESRCSPAAAEPTNVEHSGPCQAQIKTSQSKSAVFKESEDNDEEMPRAYRHVPQVAATQFERTTTVESSIDTSSVNKVHTLSRKAMKFHLKGPNANIEVVGLSFDAPPNEHAKALKRAQSTREQQYSRNQPGRTTARPPASEADGTFFRPNKRHSLATLSGFVRNETRLSRRMSTGSVCDVAKPLPVGSFELPGGLFPLQEPSEAGNPDEHRVDWTQSDEAEAAKAAGVFRRPLSPPAIRKVTSIWAFRGRLGSLSKHAKEKKQPSPVDETHAEEVSPKSPKGGFLTRFKR